MGRIVPRIGKIDPSALLYAVAVKMAVVVLLVLVSGISMPNILQLSVFALVGVLDAILNIYFWAVLASVVISWVAPGSYHPGPQLIQQLTEPVFALARRVIPPIGGLDLSPILIFIIIQLLQSQLGRLLY